MRGLTLGLAALACGCSLMGLDEVQATPCATAGQRDLSDAHALCARELRDIPLGSCEAPVCAMQVGGDLFCVVGTPDEDGDGVGDAACIDDGSELPRDCDDADPAIGQGLAELCDGKDNDCDGRVDEDVLVAGEPTRRDVPDDATNPGDTVGWIATHASGETVTAAFRRDGRLGLLADATPSVPTAPGLGEVRLIDPATEAADPGLALTSDDTSSFVVFPAAGCTRLSAGVVRGDTLTSASFAPADPTNRAGLPSMGSHACDDSVAQRAPAVSRDGDEVVVAWLESASRGACGTGQRAPLRATTSDADASLSTEAIELGTVNDAGPPSLRYLAAADAHVLAYGDGSNLVVSTLRLSGTGIEVVSTARVDTVKVVEETALALGLVDDASAVLGVAASVGCGSNVEVVLQRFRLDRSAGTIEAAGELDRVEGGGEQRQPAVAFGASRPRGFFVLWSEDETRVRGQLLDAAGGTSGAAFDVMAPDDFGGARPTRIRGLGVAPIATGGFEILAHLRNDAPGFYAATALCASE